MDHGGADCRCRSEKSGPLRLESRGCPEISGLLRGTLESQLRHPAFQGAGFHPEQFGGAAVSPDAPVDATEHRSDVLPLHVHERDALGVRGHRRLRQLDRQDWSRRYDDRALDDVAQLTDVAGPRVALEGQHVVFRDRLDLLAERFAELVDEAPDKERQVVSALAQRRDPNRKHVQPVVEILAERALRDALLEIAVGGGDDRRLDVDRLRAAKPFDLALL